MNIKTVFISAMVVLAAVSCSKEASPARAVKPVEVVVTVADGVTRATGVTDTQEKRINSVQVFAFDRDLGIREDYSSSSSSSITLKVIPGSKRFYILANCADMSGIMSESALLAKVSYLKDNSLGAFEMITHEDRVVTATANTTIEAKVRRLVSKVSLDKVIVAFENESLAGMDFRIKGIYLTSVASSTSYSLTAAPEKYFDGASDNGSQVNALIRETGLDINLSGGMSSSPVQHTTKHVFYAYPNSSTSHTRLVLDTTLDGIAQSYSFDLSNLESNKAYSAEVKITRQNTELSDVDITVTVTDWEEDDVTTEME